MPSWFFDFPGKIKVEGMTVRMFIGLCIIVIFEESKTNLMSLVVFISLIICSTFFEH